MTAPPMTRYLRAHWRPIVFGIVFGLWVAIVTYVLVVEEPPPLPFPD